MAPLVSLIGGFIVLRLIGLAGVDALDGWQPALRGGLALMFTVTASAHFVPAMRRDLIAMVPPSLPAPGLLVTVTGVLELAGAVGLLIERTATAAAIALAVLMVVMFPANVSAARRQVTLLGKPATPIVRRSIEQVFYIAAAIAASL
ncbi:hypothetical protein ACIBH1_02075 [Nonomuraea sp. NPDC050663]|uniref:hypothetical protein n=1 Tax=Nonomuraea sp. NPDC050663 TaxID=3364370 RepID=UPI0037A95EC7